MVSALSAEAQAAPPSPAPAEEAGWIELHPKAGTDVPNQLRAAVAAREPKSRLPVAFLTASWCGPCQALKKYRHDARMLAAFKDTYIIELDGDAWSGRNLAALGYPTGVFPTFIVVDEAAKATGENIDGGAWGDNIPENMAPPLAAFFRAAQAHQAH